ncbi:MAG: hypothetical protein ABGX16_21895 [Pirellulales bacterium]
MYNVYRQRSIVGLDEHPQRVLALVLMCALLAGCGEKSPFELVAVRGKIAYSDGSLITADQLLVKFIPQGIRAIGKHASRSSETYAKVTDGTFTGLTTWKYADGVMVGHHKVVVMSLRVGSRGVGEPTTAVPFHYQDATSTPLEVEVTSGGDNDFMLMIERDS